MSVLSDATGGRIHANALVVGECGVLVRGASGSGKSALTLELLAQAEARGDFARLVGDDRVDVCARGGRLIARPHPAIAGAIEARGVGVLRLPFEPACVIRLIVDLTTPHTHPDRYPQDASTSAQICGVTLPRLSANASGVAAARKIMAYLQSFVTN